ncbi:MAG: TIGR04211 family SH3 domain-containing protein [Syntrophobacterales bacterium]|nr:TIGR04211 family SH3 domain-containing protein [Syntrophobacterales bacterium]
MRVKPWWLALWTCLLLVLGFNRIAEAATESFVTDRVEIQFRAGPGINHKLIGTLTAGIQVEVKKEQSGWCLIVPKEGPFQGKEGWVHKRHITDTPPIAKDMVTLLEENKNLKTTLSQYESEIATLKQTITSLEKALNESKNQYSKLQEEASEFLTLKQTQETLKKNIAVLREERDKLQEESKKAITSERIRWFLAGAGVLFFGWILGMIMGRRQRKRDYVISYWK